MPLDEKVVLDLVLAIYEDHREEAKDHLAYKLTLDLLKKTDNFPDIESLLKTCRTIASEKIDARYKEIEIAIREHLTPSLEVSSDNLLRALKVTGSKQ